MSRILKTSGFVALSIQMLWGMYNVFLLSNQAIKTWMIGAHAHFGVLSSLAVVLGFAIDHFGVAGLRRQLVTYPYVLGQWGLPATILVAFGTGMHALQTLDYVFGTLLLVSMITMAYTAWTSGRDVSKGLGAEVGAD